MNSSTCKGNRFEKNWMDQWGKRGNSSLWNQCQLQVYTEYRVREGRVEHTPVGKAEPVRIHAGNGNIDVKIIIIAISRLQSMAVTWNFADGIRSKVTFVNMWQTSKFQMWTKSPMNNIQHTTDIWAYINWSYLFFTLKHYIFWRKSSFQNLMLRRVPLNSTCCKTWKLVGWQSL